VQPCGCCVRTNVKKPVNARVNSKDLLRHGDECCFALTHLLVKHVANASGEGMQRRRVEHRVAHAAQQRRARRSQRRVHGGRKRERRAQIQERLDACTCGNECRSASTAVC
jgi:hypothetical protein